MEKLNKVYGKNWKKLDVQEHNDEDYDNFINAYEQMFAETDTENAPWHLIAGDDERFATIQNYRKHGKITAKRTGSGRNKIPKPQYCAAAAPCSFI